MGTQLRSPACPKHTRGVVLWRGSEELSGFRHGPALPFPVSVTVAPVSRCAVPLLAVSLKKLILLAAVTKKRCQEPFADFIIGIAWAID